MEFTTNISENLETTSLLKAIDEELAESIKQLTDAQRLKFFDSFLVLISGTEGDFRSNSPKANELLDIAERRWKTLSNDILKLKEENGTLKNRLLTIRRITKYDSK
jgi:hypothetical protein|nr:MAG TPA_asm: hypothetical protein [Caudoviricetes sp.]